MIHKIRKTWSIDMDLARQVEKYSKGYKFRDESHMVNAALKEFLHDKRQILKDLMKEHLALYSFYQERLKFLNEVEREKANDIKTE